MRYHRNGGGKADHTPQGSPDVNYAKGFLAVAFTLPSRSGCISNNMRP
jgi:hypothetical protein